MIDRSQIPFLLRLMDDDSNTVRTGVVDALRSFGDELPEALRSLPEPIPEDRILEVMKLVEPHDQMEKAPRRRAAVPREILFRPGQVVLHRRYGYRGVVVDADEECQAADDWYRGNQTQPPREQPWYHVLKDGSEEITYVAQSNLSPEPSGREVEHPFIARFFDGFEDGVYLRNDRPWPEAE